MIVGDANGADKAVQNYFFTKEPVAKIKSGLYDKASDSFFYPPEIE